MDQDKNKLLNETINRAVNIGVGLEPMDHLEGFFAQKLMIIGTAADEKYTSLAGLRKLIETQQEQTKGMDLRIARSEIYRDFSADENVAVIVEDIVLFITINTESIQVEARLSAVLEFKNQQWKVIHWHASKPDPVESEVDTFGIEQWKQKADELEKLVAERTASLVEKNRELEIESSLERVRTVAMSMNKPDDLLNICEILFKELQTLGLTELRNALIHTYFDEEKQFLDYDFSDFSGGAISRIPYGGNPIIERFIQDIRKTADSFTEFIIAGRQLDDWKLFRKTNGEPDDPRLDTISALHYYNYSIGTASIGVSTFSPISDAKRDVLKRFRNVFDFAYRRYTDVTQAEAQAREAQIEAALEKVRGRSLAMHKSEELKEVIQVVCEQFVHLTILVEHAGFIMDYKARDDMHIWLADMHEVPSQLIIPYFDSPHWNSFNEAKEKGMDFFPNHLSFEEKNRFYQGLFKLFPGVSDQTKDYYFSCPGLAISTVLLENVGLYIENFSGIPYSDEENAILMRFGKVFQQTYTRFLDLQKAEAQARESRVELSLEKVRSRSMAMHQSNELAEAASVLFQQIKDLGFEMWSCGFCIWKQDDFSELWMSADSGGLLPPMLMPYKEEPTHHKIYEASLRQEPVHEYIWEGEELKKHYEFLHTIPSVKEAIDLLKKSGLSLPTKQCYYVGFFQQGYLLIITKEPNPEMHDLSYRFTRVFEQTYTRFLDLQKAEQLTEQTKLDLIQIQTEKKRAENALTELKATQAQLIQKEKLASLGELTAGIAHEIQNPLNFVNNFSEVSAELVSELRDEATKADRDPALMEELLGDLAQNLEKITHHGTRASRIVKGMLDHSRNSIGERHPTDLSALTNEYLRLSYQGWVANHPRFTCEVITRFDPDLGKVEVVPPEIGRVLLNLFNNAFYAVAQKQKNSPLTPEGRTYLPIVQVSTRQQAPPSGAGGAWVEIRVRDNGTGITEAVKAKIFQPFFTTKPTGEGTGLGLSLSYDVVTKGHGGLLTVQSVPHQFTEFLIQLPA